MEPMTTQLRSIQDINQAREDLYNKTITGQVDPRLANMAERMLEGATRLNIELRIRYGILLGRHKGTPPVRIPWLESEAPPVAE